MKKGKAQMKAEFGNEMERRLPCVEKDNHGRWFVAKKSGTGISIEMIGDQRAARSRLAELLSEPNTEASRDEGGERL